MKQKKKFIKLAENSHSNWKATKDEMSQKYELFHFLLTLSRDHVLKTQTLKRSEYFYFCVCLRFQLAVLYFTSQEAANF